jgi:hypothetical protein
MPVVSMMPAFAPYTQRRPGLITTIGVFCVIVAGISILGGGVTGLINFAMASASRTNAVQRQRANAAAVAAATPVHVSLGEYVCPDGLSLADRQTALVALESVRPLSQARTNQLDELLAVSGKSFLPGDSGPLDGAIVRAMVSRSGSGAEENSPDYFVLGSGRIEVSDDRAAYIPSDGGTDARVTAPDLPPLPAGAAAPPLNDDQIRSVLRVIAHQAPGQTIRAAQTKALVDLLRQPGEQLITPTTDGSDPAWQIQLASVGPDSSLHVTATHAKMTSEVHLDPAGNVTSTATAPTFAMPMLFPKLNRTAALLAGGLTFANLLLAIYLLVVGIFVLRDSFKARLMAWIYIGLKLPVTLGVAFSVRWMWDELLASIATAPGQMVQGLGVASKIAFYPPLVGAIFPVVLAMLLLTPSVREFYRPQMASQ